MKKVLGGLLIVCLIGLYLQIGSMYMNSLGEASALISRGEYHKLNLFQKFQVSPFKILSAKEDDSHFFVWILCPIFSLFFWLLYFFSIFFAFLKRIVLHLANDFFSLLLLTMLLLFFYNYFFKKSKQKNKGC